MVGLNHTTIFLFINQSLANPITDIIMPFVTADLNLKIFYGLCLTLILWKGDKRLRLAIIASIITLVIWINCPVQSSKPLFARPRPCKDLIGTSSSFLRGRIFDAVITCCQSIRSGSSVSHHITEIIQISNSAGE